MAPRKWMRHEEGLIVTPTGICIRCPNCGALIHLVAEKYDVCDGCGWTCRIIVETREPMIYG